jgi:chemotaxis signal transduction protein
MTMDQEVARLEGVRRYLLVRSGGTRWALPADQVRRVVRNLACHPVPGGQPHLLGLAQYGGEPLAVLDLHTLVTGETLRSSHLATVILGRRGKRSGAVLGLAIDEAQRVMTLAHSPQPGSDDSLVQGTVTIDGDPVKVLNTAGLFSHSEDADA